MFSNFQYFAFGFFSIDCLVRLRCRIALPCLYIMYNMVCMRVCVYIYRRHDHSRVCNQGGRVRLLTNHRLLVDSFFVFFPSRRRRRGGVLIQVGMVDGLPGSLPADE